MDYQQMDFNTKKMKIAFVGDLHIGSLNCKKEAFESALRWANENNAYLVTMGDLGDFITPKDKRFDAENVDRQFLTMNEQLDYIESQLATIKDDRFIGMIVGNHYGKWQTADSYFNEKVNMCKRLGTHFFGTHALLTMKLKEDERVFSFWHGAGGATATGAIVNKMTREASMFDADVYLMGHTHKLFNVLGSRLRNRANNEDRQEVMKFANTGCFLASYQEGVGGYGEAKGFGPSTIGFTLVTLEDGWLPQIQDAIWYKGRFEIKSSYDEVALGKVRTEDSSDVVKYLKGLSRKELMQLIAAASD